MYQYNRTYMHGAHCSSTFRGQVHNTPTCGTHIARVGQGSVRWAAGIPTSCCWEQKARGRKGKFWICKINNDKVHVSMCICADTYGPIWDCIISHKENMDMQALGCYHGLPRALGLRVEGWGMWVWEKCLQ